MASKSSLPVILLWISRAGAILVGLITGFLIVMSFIALLGGLPNKMNATYEVPITLKNMEDFYITKDLNSKYQSTHFEVKKANLEVLPTNKRWPQFLAFFLAGVYLALFLGILILLSNILKAFTEKKPFAWSNVRMIRWIGYITIAIGIFEFIINIVISQIFHNKFAIFGK
jgi:hypothetical protein